MIFAARRVAFAAITGFASTASIVITGASARLAQRPITISASVIGINCLISLAKPK